MAKRIVVALLGALLCASEASAQTTADRERQAKEAYEAGIVQYNIAEYDKAIEHFKKAYELTKAPALLFNIAQAYRLKKDCESAKRFYTNYHREESAVNPGDPNIKEAESFIAEMERCLQSGGGTAGGSTAANPTPSPSPGEPKSGKPNNPTATLGNPTPGGGNGGEATEPPPVERVEPDEPSSPGSGMKTAGLIVGAAGLVSVGIGIYFAVKSNEYNDKAMEMCTLGADCPWDDKGESANILAWTFGVGGAVVAGVGGYLYYLGLRKDSSTEVSIVPSPTGPSFVISGTF